MRKVYWATIRISFFVLLLLMLITGGLSVFILYPVYVWYFSGDLRFSKNNKFILPMISKTYRYMYDFITNPGYRKSFPIQFASLPRIAPDRQKVRIRADWPVIDGSCNGCSYCCKMRGCPFMDEHHRCAGYGSLYWRYFNCGRFPETQKQIDYYSCPKWEIIH